jgi:membrane protease YdiL (CAAX protease family)
MARAPSASATEPGPDRGPDFHGPAAGGPDGPSLSTAALLANVSLSQGLVAVVLLAGAWYFAIPATALGVAADPWVTGLPALLLGTVFGAVLWAANELGAAVADASGASYDERVRELLAPATPLGWVALLGVVLPTVAVAEELLFRASLVGVAHAGLGVSSWLLAAASSLAFAAGHGAQGRAGVLVTGVLGFGLAAGYVLTGSLLVVVVAHYLVNALEFVVHEGPGRSVLAAPDR